MNLFHLERDYLLWDPWPILSLKTFALGQESLHCQRGIHHDSALPCSNQDWKQSVSVVGLILFWNKSRLLFFLKPTWGSVKNNIRHFDWPYWGSKVSMEKYVNRYWCGSFIISRWFWSTRPLFRDIWWVCQVWGMGQKGKHDHSFLSHPVFEGVKRMFTPSASSGSSCILSWSEMIDDFFFLFCFQESGMLTSFQGQGGHTAWRICWTGRLDSLSKRDHASYSYFEVRMEVQHCLCPGQGWWRYPSKNRY